MGGTDRGMFRSVTFYPGIASETGLARPEGTFRVTPVTKGTSAYSRCGLWCDRLSRLLQAHAPAPKLWHPQISSRWGLVGKFGPGK